MYGDERLPNRTEQTVLRSAAGNFRGVTTDLQLFVKDSPQFDDITMLALKIMLLKATIADRHIVGRKLQGDEDIYRQHVETPGCRRRSDTVPDRIG